MRRSVIVVGIEAAWPAFPVPRHHRDPAVLAMRRIEMERIAGPVRELFALLEAGEVFEAEGRPVMRSHDAPECWVEVAPVLEGWIDCLVRLAPDLPCRALGQLSRFLNGGLPISPALGQLSRFLNGGLPISPALVAQARAEFELQAARVADARAEDVRLATLGAQVAWEVERLGLASEA